MPGVTGLRPPRASWGCISRGFGQTARLTRPPTMQKTNKAVRKRFKISSTGKIMRHRAGRRHLAGSKTSKKSRSHRRAIEVHPTDRQRVTKNLPFGA